MSRRFVSIRWLRFAPFLFLLVPCGHAQGSKATLQYNRDVRPILTEACLSCHGPDSAARQADLRLDKRESAVNGGAIVPGHPDTSKLIRRILSGDPAERMPPPETKKNLTEAQKKVLVRWIREGAEYQPHWSLIAPVRPRVPQVRNSLWVRNPIDNFVAARLESEGLRPAAEADRRTLARRLSLDLIGLPPTPEEVDDFVSDSRPEAYERLIDKLLASPHWGEHRGRYWLDAARYADTHGIHLDNYRAMWPYRDWVINAFNHNMPFDEFTIENLAGDLLPHATIDQQVGSGFNRCNTTTSEGGAIEEEYLVLYARDRVETTSQVWLGLTAGCAVCHDHKFDPLKQREFYQLAAFFNNTDQKGMDGNVKDTPPVLLIVSDADRPRWDELNQAVPKLQAELTEMGNKLRPEFDLWLASNPNDLQIKIPQSPKDFAAPLDDDRDRIRYELANESHEVPVPSTTFWVAGRTGRKCALSNSGAILAAPDAGDFEINQPFTISAWIKLRDNDPRGAIAARVDDSQASRGWDFWIEDRRIGVHLINRWPTSAIYVTATTEFAPEQWVHVAAVYDGSGRASGIKLYMNGRQQNTKIVDDTLTGTIRNTAPFKLGARKDSAALNGLGIEDVFVYRAALGDADILGLKDVRLSKILSGAPEKRTAEETELLFDWWLTNKNGASKNLSQRLQSLVEERSKIKARSKPALVMHEKSESARAYVLNRGEYDQRREKVEPATPAMLPPFPADLPHNRLGFSKWLLRADQPLTARVTVNRFWSEIFGTGLVKTAGDFGVQGELPSHPELLDWLAVDFSESGWDVKRLFRLIVTSATYRQCSVASHEAIERDPENRLLSRGPRFRMDAEMIRDYALTASGLLSPKIGGPSVKPYQPRGVWEAVAMLQSNTRSYQQDVGDSVYRRSLYTLWKRSAPPASMEIFNAPTREVCVVARERTNTPLQALVTMNDPQFLEAARRLAERALKAVPGIEDRAQFIAKHILARELRPSELRVILKTLDEFNDYYVAEPADAVKVITVGDSVPDNSISPAALGAWTMVASQLMNLDEVLNK